MLDAIKSQIAAMSNDELFSILKTRFENNKRRNFEINYNDILEHLNQNIAKLDALKFMEVTGGEPDIVKYDIKTNQYIIFDCAEQSPIGRRSLCYDKQALESRKANKPIGSAIDLANQFGLKLLNEDEYIFLQSIGNFDTKTSSWLETPQNVRELNGAIFGDKRFNRTFIYHNGAESYYAARGFRVSLIV